MNKIIVVDPNKRINIEQIKQHPFYLKGKSEFEKKHKDLVEQVEFDVNKIFNNDIEDYNNDIEDDIVFNINYNVLDTSMKVLFLFITNLVKYSKIIYIL